VQAGHNALLLPGVIAKRAAGLYYSGERTREWLKFKTVHEQGGPRPHDHPPLLSKKGTYPGGCRPSDPP